ncbi:hypothetical protein GQ44DRAFT_728881 [Phaeosphaeriaceae sp. PMI808]|nr:hypothetical protein GQ44DRAFT_728881 [Phaeosphaeriaceae sp. PMI808]
MDDPISKPIPTPIPKTRSLPADQNKQSFLTGLLPEIRVLVYEVLFKRDDPVLVYNAEAYDSNPEIPVAEFVHYFHLGLPLLLSCRQIYHESAWVLYGINKFIISRPLVGHDFTSCDHLSEGSQLEYAPWWLSDLGSQVLLLRNVTIDIDAVCPEGCPDRREEIEMMPILHFLWKIPGWKCSLSFAHTGRALANHESLVESGDILTNRAEMPNNILIALAEQDILNIRSFRKFRRLIRSLEVSLQLNKGWIVWRRYKAGFRFHGVDVDGMCLEKLDISDGDRMLQIRDENEVLNAGMIFPLPMIVIKTIFKFVTHSPNGIVFDLDNHRVRGLQLNIFHLN